MARPEKPLALGWAVSDGGFLPHLPAQRRATASLFKVGKSYLYSSESAFWVNRRCKIKANGRVLKRRGFEGVRGRLWCARCDALWHRLTHHSWPRPSRPRSRGLRRTPTVWRCSALCSCTETGTASRYSQLETWERQDDMMSNQTKQKTAWQTRLIGWRNNILVLFLLKIKEIYVKM